VAGVNDPHRDQLIAYLATLATLVLCFIGALVVGAFNEAVIGKIEMFGMGTLVGGLIGVLRLPQQRSVTVDNTNKNPVQTEDAETK
jgi:hypothetical protein